MVTLLNDIEVIFLIKEEQKVCGISETVCLSIIYFLSLSLTSCAQSAVAGIKVNIRLQSLMSED